MNSGFISRNNPDETAKNFFLLNQQAGLPRERTVTWNIVPWYVGSGTRIRPVTYGDIAAAEPYLAEFIGLLPRLRVAVLLGRKAERAENRLRGLAPGISVLVCPHPSPLFINNRPGNAMKILRVLQKAAALLDS